MKQNNYQNSQKVGRYVGPVLTALFLSEIITLHIYDTPASPHIVYLNGFVLLLFGFYLVTIHNVWTKHWPLLITLSAWATVMLGLYRLFFPTAAQAHASASVYVLLAAFTAIEIFITIKSYKK